MSVSIIPILIIILLLTLLALVISSMIQKNKTDKIQQTKPLEFYKIKQTKSLDFYGTLPLKEWGGYMRSNRGKTEAKRFKK